MVRYAIEETPARWDEIVRQVEAGETIQLVRANRVIAVLQSPTEQDDLRAWAQYGAQAMARSLPADEFADWEKPEGTHGTR